MKLIVDTNIVVDYLRIREPFYQSAELLMVLGLIGEFDLLISASQLSDLFYVLTAGGKKSKAREAKQELMATRSFLGICPLGVSEVDDCLNSDWDDVEDALVYQAARSIQADAIITRNQRDFSRSRIPVFDCDEFFAWLREERRIDYAFAEL